MPRDLIQGQGHETFKVRNFEVSGSVGARPTSCSHVGKFLMDFSNGLSGPLYIWFDAWVFRSADRMALVRVFGISG